MILKNNDIYTYGSNLAIFNECDVKMPVRINFYLQKNIQLIRAAAEEIETARFSIGAQYGTLSEDGAGYQIPAEDIGMANQELEDLFALEQELNLHIFKLSDFDGIELTYQQMSAIIFMVEED